MPIYEFVCKDCGKTFEKLVLTKEEEVDITCPFCKSENTKKIISNVYSLLMNSLYYGGSCEKGGSGFS